MNAGGFEALRERAPAGPGGAHRFADCMGGPCRDCLDSKAATARLRSPLAILCFGFDAVFTAMWGEDGGRVY